MIPHRLLACLLVCAGAASAAPALVTLHDFRTFTPPVEVGAATQAKLLRIVRARLNLPVCEGGEVRQELTGRFTRNTPQTAYLVYSCGAVAANMMRKEFGRLVIFEKGQYVTHFTRIGDAVRLLPDLNQDGLHELLFITAIGPHMGEFLEDASVISLADGKVRSLLDVDDALNDTCSSGGLDARQVAWRLRAEFGKRPVFTLDRYEAACGDEAPFQYQFSRRVLANQ